MSERSTDEVVLRELARIVEPLVSAAKTAEETGPGELRGLVGDMGLDVVPDAHQRLVEETFEATAGAFLLVDTILDIDADDEVDLEGLIEAIEDVVAAVKDLDETRIDHPHVDAIGDLVIDYLLVRYVETYHPGVYAVLRAGKVITDRPGRTPENVDFSALGDLFGDTSAAIEDVFRWGSDEFLGFLVSYYLHDVLWEIGLEPRLEDPNVAVFEQLGVDLPDSDLVPESVADLSDPDTALSSIDPESLPEQLVELGDELDVPVARVEGAVDAGVPTAVTAGFSLLPLPATTGPDAKPPGLALIPYGAAALEGASDPDGDWVVSFDLSGDVDGYAFVVRPGSSQFVELGSSGDAGEFHGAVELAYDAASGPGGETTIVGDPEASRLAVSSISARAGVEYDGDGMAFVVGFPTEGAIVIDPDDLGGFLKKVLPADGIDFDFDVTPGWASDAGLFLETGGTLEIALPQNAELGPITVTEIYLGVTPRGDGFKLVGATSAKVSIGPVVGTVGRVGVAADLTFPEDRDGNLGPVDLDVGFEPPSRIGLKIDSGAVTGGGYLEFDPEHHRYAGTLQLQFAKFTVNAIGLLTTELPGGGDGYSLLILITAQDLSIQLGMGFTLDGIGGLLGVHRSMQPEPLRGAVKTGSLDSVLFPEHPVENAPRIISDLRSIFPPTKDQFVIGPMLRVGWGQPTLITADVGVVLQLPRGRVAILGRISADLPDEEVGIVTLNMDALGLILPREKRASLDASLYDSRVVVFALTGGMAMRSAWGDRRRFLLSVGGFHPEFDPPGDFPDIDRLKISLSKGAFKLEIRGYFAVTSNTVQMGTHAELWLGKGKWGVRGWLGFDALFRWEPEFQLLADFVAGVEITPIGISLTVEGHLSGPSPWKIRGKIKLKIVFVTIKIPIKATIGPRKDQPGLPEAKVLPKLVEALEQPENWEASLPDDEMTVVSFREVEAAGGEVLAHPLGTFGVRQQVVPLKGETAVTIDTFGNARPGDFRQFDIPRAHIGADGDGPRTDLPALEEPFAPAQFFELTDAEKLERDGYEPMVAGRLLASRDPVVAGGAPFERATRVTTLAYETSVVDEVEDNYGTPLADLGRFSAIPGADVARMRVPVSTTRVTINASAVAQAETRTTGLQAYRPGDVITDGDRPEQDPSGDLSVPVGTTDRGYVLSRTDELGAVDLEDVAAADRLTRTEAEQVLGRHIEANPEEAETYQVVAAHTAAAGTGGPAE